MYQKALQIQNISKNLSSDYRLSRIFIIEKSNFYDKRVDQTRDS